MGAKLVPNYLENVTTPDQYEILEMNRISGFVNRAKGLGRPTKKDRRELEQFTEPEFMDDGFDFEFDFVAGMRRGICFPRRINRNNCRLHTVVTPFTSNGKCFFL